MYKKIILILIATVVCLFIYYSYISKPSPGSGNKQPPPVGHKVNTYVWKRDIDKGAYISSDDYSQIEITINHTPEQTMMLTRKKAELIKGGLLRTNVRKGEYVLDNQIVTPNSDDFVPTALNSNLRALSVAVDEGAISTALIKPGNYVDVLYAENERNNRSAITLIENVKVLGVNKQLISANSDEGDNNNRNVNSYVTLELTPTQVEIVLLARTNGKLVLSLRNNNQRDFLQPVTAIAKKELIRDTGNKNKSEITKLTGEDKRDK